MATDPTEREAFAEGFIGVSRSELEAMPDAELAQWQAGWAPGNERHILAEKEWLRRLSMRQLHEQFKLEEQVAKVNRWWGIGSSLIGVVGTLAGVFLGLWLAPPTASTTAQGQVAAPSPAKFSSTPQVASAPTPSASGAIQAHRASQASLRQ